MLMDGSGVGQLRSISCMSGSLNPCTHHLAWALYPVSVSFQCRTRREEITRSRCFLSYHIRLHGVYDCHRLEIEYSLPFCFDCFRKLRLLFGRKVVPRYLVGVPSTEIKILHAVCSPRPTQSKRFRVPCFLRRRSSVSPPLLSGCSSFFHLWSASIIRVGHVASSLYILPKVLPRSCSCRVALQLDYHLHQLYSPVGARTSLLRRNEKEQRIHLSQLVLVFSHAVPPSTPGPRKRPGDVSGNHSLLEIEPCDH